jgi:drug/metabolite transporter (DMT)-like permease
MADHEPIEAKPLADRDAPVAPGLALGRAEWGMLGALSIIWGGSFLFMAVAARELPTLTIVAARVTLAAAVLWAVIALRGAQVPRGRAVLGAFLVMGIVNNALPFALLVIAAREIPAGLAATLNAATPLLTVVIAGIALADEPLRPNRLVGVAIGLGGVAAMMGIGQIAVGAAQGAGPLWAQGAVLLAALSYAGGAVFGRIFARLGIDPMVTAAGQISAAALIVVPLALWVDAPWRLGLPSAEALAALGALAVVSTGFAYVLYFRILARAGAGNIAAVTLLVPVSATLLGALVLGERPGLAQGVGFVLIAAGLAVMQWPVRRLAIGPGRD